MTNENSNMVFCLKSKLINLNWQLWTAWKIRPAAVIFDFCIVILIFTF